MPDIDNLTSVMKKRGKSHRIRNTERNTVRSVYGSDNHLAEFATWAAVPVIQ